MVGNGRTLHAQRFLYLLEAHRPLGKHLQNPYPVRVGEGLEGFRSPLLVYLGQASAFELSSEAGLYREHDLINGVNTFLQHLQPLFQLFELGSQIFHATTRYRFL